MRTFWVVEEHIFSDGYYCFYRRVVFSQVYFFLFDSSPKSFNEYIVSVSSASVHTDTNTIWFKDTREGTTGELRPLIGIEEFRCSVVFYGFLECFGTEGYIHRVGDSPGENLPTVPIDDGNEVDESSLQAYIGDIGAPYLIRMSNLQVSEKVWILLVCLVRYRCILLRIDGSYTECLHEASDFEMSCIESFLFEHDTHPSWPEEWMFGIYLIESFKDLLFLGISNRYVVVAGTGDTKKFRLSGNREKREIHVHEREFSSMVTFLQAVYIFFWASHVQS